MLGSVRAVTNEQGLVIARHDFEPFGEEVSPQSPPKDRKLFTGQERDFETALDYFNARQYRPDLGQFTAPDPLSELPSPAPSQGLSAYAYVANNPTGYTDPTGLQGQQSTGLTFWGFFNFFGSSWPSSTFQLGSFGGMSFSSSFGRSSPSAGQMPPSAIAVLGKLVAISYGRGLSSADDIALGGKIVTGAALINANAGSLAGPEKNAIGQISSIAVLGPRSYLGATGKGSMTLSAAYVRASSAAWLGSLFGHEGQHYLNAGRFSGVNLWKDEQFAGKTQLRIGMIIGFTPSEIRYLQQWIDDSNKAAMQQHMLQGYRY